MMKIHQSQKIKREFIKIPGVSPELILLRAESKNSGPIIWLTGGIHGDEVGGVKVVYEIFKKLKKLPLKRGAVFAFPLINQYGLKNKSRFFNTKKEDLNRSFPGNPRGTAAEKAADKIFTAILKTKPTLILDLHNDWIDSIPYALIDPKPKNPTWEQTKKFARQTGLLVIRDEATKELKKSLSGSMRTKVIPALTLELGGASKKNVKTGVDAIWNVLFHLKMAGGKSSTFQNAPYSWRGNKQQNEPFPHNLMPHRKVLDEKNYFVYPKIGKLRGKILKYSNLSSRSAGAIEFLARPGALVKKGEAVARIYNNSDKVVFTIKAPTAGVILGNSDSAVARPNEPIVAFGII